LTSETAEPSTVDAWLGAGAKVERVPDLATGLEVLGRHGVLQAMVEGGPTLVDALFTAGLVDRFVVYLAPRVLGGEGIPAVSVPATLRTIGARPVGNDVRLDYLPAAEDR
jgi:diaminohydroxyphosphoribosylaminopyrimidine deaminase/5-amino-6-(5-phosphoribosylamino)uracil reductase